MWGSQVEITESVVPVRIVRRELRPGSGGPGRFRGGLGQVIELESTEDAPSGFFAAVDRMTSRTGAPRRATGCRADHALLRSELPGKGEQTIPAGERLIFETPGGGGYGNPLERSPDTVALDVQRGLLSVAAARQSYSVAITRTGAVDFAETGRLRARTAE